MKSKYNLSEKPITPWYKDSSFLFLPIYLSIQFIKTDRFKNVNKTIRCCLIAVFLVALFLFAGLSGTSGRSAHELETTQPIGNSIVYVPKTPLEAQQEPFILNTSTHKFHKPTCRDVPKIAAENRSDVHTSRDNIVAQGYTPADIAIRDHKNTRAGVQFPSGYFFAYLNACRRRRQPRRSTSRGRAASRSSHHRPPSHRPSARGPGVGGPT